MQTQVGVGNELQRSYRMQDFASPGVIMRERSFIRPQSHHNMHHNQFPNNGKRRSMILTNAKGKPTLEIYRPPGVRTDGVGNAAAAAAGKLNVHAKEFTMAKPNDLQNRSAMGIGYASVGLQHSRSAVLHAQVPPHYRPVMPHGLLNTTSSSNVPHTQSGGPRVHFKLQPQQVIIPEKKKSPPSSLLNGNGKSIRPQSFTPGLKRSKSLTSADALASGMAALGLAADAGDLGNFPVEIQECIDKALEDPNAVCARTLMDAVNHLVGRAVESPRYALPAARRCIAVVEREQTETFLESLLNTCQQWYHDREKLLGTIVGGGRPRLMAFLSFLLEMYCQLRRRQIQRRGGTNTSAQPGQVLLTLICKCCEDCIRQPVPSPSDTENLFFVLTYIGRDLESQLPGDLERLLSAVRDAFLNTAAAPSIRRTLLQLIELHASRWQLPGCASGGPRVHFKLQPQQVIIPEKKKSPPSSLLNGNGKCIRPQSFTPGLKRSKSLTSSDALASGMAALGLAADAGDLGNFPVEIQECIDKALEDPNAVCARTLMDAVNHLVGRAVESSRYALPAARRCIAVVEREQTETFLESLLNTCQQWYHDREKLLGTIVDGSRPRLMAFLSFLFEMYCQLRLRQVQRRGGTNTSAQPGQVLLTLICKCCEDCIRQPVPSPSDTEKLFFVVTYIGRVLESELPGVLERLLSAVRDAILNTAAAPSTRRTLLQLIELHASRWQLPGCAELYYYPSSK